jgi:hypothetical protein
MCVEECTKSYLVMFPDLAQDPPDCFVDEILAVVEEERAERERVGEVALGDVGKGRNDTDPALPEELGASENVEWVARAL